MGDAKGAPAMLCDNLDDWKSFFSGLIAHRTFGSHVWYEKNDPSVETRNNFPFLEGIFLTSGVWLC